MGRGKTGGALADVHPVDLLAQVLRALVDRNRIDPGEVDDVLIGCVSQVGEQSNTPGRQALLSAGFPVHVPSATIERKCGSGQQAIHFAAQGVMSGQYDIAIAGGVEMMSRIPMGSARQGADIFGPGVASRFAPGLVSQGVAAELIARKWDLSRAELDAYSLSSQQRAHERRAAGGFAHEIVPIVTASGLVDQDQTIRPETTLESLAGLRPSFADADPTQRFPGLSWQLTAGNSSQLADGAAAVLVMSAAAAKRLGLRPRARLAAFDVVADDPLLMLTAPIPATRRVLKKAGLAIHDIDHFEVNEAFAPVPLAWAKELEVDPRRLNPVGGAIALGHPLGASGARLMATMLNAMESSGQRWGLQTMCEAGGMANATIIERL
jgi:acetyl-CoA acetyltransferase family protein